METLEWYAKWHNNPRHQFHHWMGYAAITLIVSAAAVSGISQFVSSVDADVSTASMPVAAQTARRPVTPPGLTQLAVPEPAQDHILVKFKDNVGQTRKAQVLAKHGLSEKSDIKDIGVKLVSIPDSLTPDEAVQSLKAEGDVEFAEVDGTLTAQATPNDPNYGSQWYLPQISAPAGWDISTGTPGVIIAMVDTGLDPSNPEFAPKLVPGWNYITGSSVIVDNTGHGSATAQTAAAATNNNYNIAGVSWNSPIMPLVVCDSTGSCMWSNVASAITYAADHGAKVINISLGGTSDSSAMQSAVNYAWSKGLVIVAAACNNSSSVPCYPGAEQNVVAVSATCDTSNTFAGWSNFGSYIDLAAPGCNINGWSGTSLSSPIVAGAAALVFSAKPTLSNAQVVSLLESNADDAGTPGWDQYYGYGLVDVAQTLSAIGSVAVDTLAPSIPVNVSAYAASNSQVTVSWNPSTDNVGVAGYNVYRNGTKVASVTGNSYTDNTVSALTAYSYTVSAYDASGNVSGQSSPAAVTTPAAVVSLSITSFQVTNKTTSSATIVWTTNVPSTGTVSYGSSKNSLSLTATDGTTGTSHSLTLTGLATFSTYYYRIQAASQDGSSTAQTTSSSFKTARK